MVDCTTPGCRKTLPISTLVGTDVKQLTRAVSSDCAQNIVYLTDDPGLIDVDSTDYPAWLVGTTYEAGETIEDAGVVYTSLIDGNIGNTPAASPTEWQGTYLTANNRFQVVTSASQIATHWNECTGGVYSSAFWDSNGFFQLGSGTGVSPGFFIITYWDRDGAETIAQALDALYECFQCFEILVHPTYLNDGADFFDTSLQKDLEAWAAINDDKIVSNLTEDAVMPASFVETTSQAAQANALSYKNSHYTWAGELCVATVDGSCVETGASEVLFSPTHFKYAAFLASFSTSAPSYIPDPFFRGDIQGEPTADLTASETINVTGTDRAQGGQLADATRYANVYHSVAGRRGFLYGSGVTGFFSYDLMQTKYIKRDMENEILDVLNRATNRGISTLGLSSIETRLISLATKYENQDIITLDVQDFDDRVPDGYVIIGQGAGWLLTREPIEDLSLAELSQGFSPSYFFCYVNLRQLRFVDLTICALLKPDQLSEVF